MDFYHGYDPAGQAKPRNSSWNDWSLTRIMSLSFIAPFFQNQYLFDSLRLFILGTIIETGRRLSQWLFDRFKFQYCITARFDEGDPAYEWILLFLTEKDVWRRSRDFSVSSKNSKRKWGIKTAGPKIDKNADYVPTYEVPQLFRWNGYWVEVKRNKGNLSGMPHMNGGQSASVIYLSIYTLKMEALSNLVEEARMRYKETSRPHVIIYTADMPTYGPGIVWNSVKNKTRRPLSSIILLDGVIDSLVKDAREFIDAEEWYIEAGIPYRRGYLLHGPPGTGKTSTIYALAGELGLEIYSLSLSSNFVDDAYLQKAASSIPKHSIFLIEDIDCAFPSRAEGDDSPGMGMGMPMNAPYYGMVPGMVVNGQQKKSLVTLSGLLNVLDGVGSEEGKLFFATTNYLDHLDTALLRPGRIDKKVQYFQATQDQAAALYKRFYAPRARKAQGANEEAIDKSGEKFIQPASSSTDTTSNVSSGFVTNELSMLASKFGSQIPTHTFSTAELQGYLLMYKKEPEKAAENVKEWTEKELEERRQKEERKKKDRRGGDSKGKEEGDSRKAGEDGEGSRGLPSEGVGAGGPGVVGAGMGGGPMGWPGMGMYQGFGGMIGGGWGGAQMGLAPGSNVGVSTAGGTGTTVEEKAVVSMDVSSLPTPPLLAVSGDDVQTPSIPEAQDKPGLDSFSLSPHVNLVSSIAATTPLDRSEDVTDLKESLRSSQPSSEFEFLL